jgi:crotonobetainyl-CoA:carnitine CoA-transferase CaiB-like acyl-CoA transferase
MVGGGPLSGYRVIDVTAMISGPLATQILADQGADVIKVENPAGGDHTRASPNRRGGLPAVFLNNNRNKRSVAIDLKHERGRELVIRLVSGADVFVQNFRPGVADRIGLGEEVLRRAAPRIVYASISGFGERGPMAAKPAYDPLVQAFSGLATVQGGSDEQRPRLVRTILADKLTAVTAAQAITAALAARERGGEGQHVRVSMLDSVMAFLWSSDMASQTFVGEELPQAEAATFIDLIYETRDGYLSVAVQTDREWQALARALERPQWLADERFRTPALRQRNVDARLELIQEALRARSSAEWLARLEAEGVPCAPVLTRAQVIRHPQIAGNQSVCELDHPQAGRLRQARPAARFSRTPAPVARGAPRLGEHTASVLAELGLSAAEIAELRAARTIAFEE